MTIFNGLNTSASALTTKRLRMDVISANIANADSTRTRFVDGQWEPYRRKMVVTSPNEAPSFASQLQRAIGRSNSTVGNGVKVDRIVEDQTPFKQVYNPDHPDADENGFIQLPNVDPLREMVDLMTTTRSYEANVTAINGTKNMLLKALEIGR
ncbi:flagellar basal body rod protein FlgC [Bacillus sp. JCM 19034]|uniref:flagellar basal body rod protein FlgC n=1 Tax=Bacillus sp. JCM 19034 TaxID=1481928 RepID=UPI000AB61F70|nr:flagellar basal body rod protein FlgC [Bacillus sp. JCM 19034]